MDEEENIQRKESVVRVLIVDAQPAVRQALSSIINRQPDMKVVAASEGHLNLVELHKASKPDVTLLDLEISGSTGIQDLLRDYPKACVIALSLYDDPPKVQEALQAGARMSLLKGSDRFEVLQAIRNCAQIFCNRPLSG